VIYRRSKVVNNEAKRRKELRSLKSEEKERRKCLLLREYGGQRVLNDL
jgi:hypothetical protein